MQVDDNLNFIKIKDSLSSTRTTEKDDKTQGLYRQNTRWIHHTNDQKRAKSISSTNQISVQNELYIRGVTSVLVS